MSRLRLSNVPMVVVFLACAIAAISIKAERQAMAAKQHDMSSGRAESDAVPDSCPVTKPLKQYVPPSPYPQTPSGDTFWFGSDHLWANLPADGTWKGLQHYKPSDPTFRQKLFLWRQFYDVHTEPQPELAVTGRRLDSYAPPLLADRTTNGWAQRDQPFMLVGINFPTLGCWEIKAHYTGHYADDELTFVVWLGR
jgi:hypothetical protein